MSRKRPTEASWDSDDDLLNEDSYSFTAVRSNKDFDDDLDEDALLGSDDETGNNKASHSGTGKSIGTVISSTNKRTEKISPVQWETKIESKPSDLVLEDEIELIDPDVDIGFDTFDAGDISQQEDQSYTEPVDESVYDQQEDAETTYEKFQHEDEASHGESDESEDEGDKRGGRFKSERQNIVTITSKSSNASEIPDTLEISDEQQKQINEFMSQKDKKKRPYRPNNQFQQQVHPGRIQTITSTSSYSMQHVQPAVLTQQAPVISAPPPLTSAGRPKIYMNPHFKRGKSSSVSRNGHQPQPLMHRPPPPMYRHEPSPPRHQYEPTPPNHQYEHPMMDQYRHDRPLYPPPPHHHHHMPPPPPPHHVHQGPPPTSQHYPASLMNSPPRFQHQPEPRPLFDRPPPMPHRVMDGYERFHQPPPSHGQYYPPPPQPRHPRPLFPFEPSHGMESSVRPNNPFNTHHQHEGHRTEHFNQPPRPLLLAQDFPPRMPMHHQPRNNIHRPRQPLLRGQQNMRFQGPRPTLQQQQSKKILQKAREERAKKFGSIQNIPVIGRQTTKRPSTDTDEASPTKTIKTETAQSIGLTQEESDEYIKKMEQQKALRAEILRKKELKRQTDAAKRRKDLEEKLKREGKNIEELEITEEPSTSGVQNIGRGQSQGILAHQTNIGRGQMQGQHVHPPNIGRGQRGFPANMGRGQQTFQAHRGRGVLASAGRGGPHNVGRGQTSNMVGQEGQSQVSQRGRGQFRGRGQENGGMRGEQIKLKPGQTHIIDGSGKAEVVKKYTTFIPGNGRGRGNSDRHVLEPVTREEVGDKPAVQVINEIAMKRALLAQGNMPQAANTLSTAPSTSNQQVDVGHQQKVRRMKRVIRTKKNAKGEILSTDVFMVPLDEDNSMLSQVPIATPVVTSPVLSTPQRVVVNSSEEESQRTVIASNVLGDGRRNIVMNDSPDQMSRKVCIENLSLSTADSSVKRLCSCVGPIKNYQRLGKSVYVTFIDANNAKLFVHKYNRHMIDLSHIMVKSIPE